MTRKARRRRDDDPTELSLEDAAMAKGAYALLVAGAVATGLTGSWLPMIGTTAAVYLSGWFANRRSKVK